MIPGGAGPGGPYVEARAWLPRFGLRESVDLLFDPASRYTVLSRGDLPGLGMLPPDDIAPVDGVFGVSRGVPAAAILSFTTESGSVHAEFVTLVVAEGPAQTSRLGRDVLNGWLTVYDPREANLLFEPYDSGDAAAR